MFNEIHLFIVYCDFWKNWKFLLDTNHFNHRLVVFRFLIFQRHYVFQSLQQSFKREIDTIEFLLLSVSRRTILFCSMIFSISLFAFSIFLITYN